MEWISVEESLPSDNSRVLTFSNHSLSSAIGHWTRIIHGNNCVININKLEDFDRLSVTHWMQLPNEPVNPPIRIEL